jgi:RNA polymerase sigma factor (sigma-70 family)
MTTLRSHQISHLLSSVRAGVRAARLRAPYADDAVQDTLVALLPHLEKLSALPIDETRAYAYVAASRTAMAIRKQVGAADARGTDDELANWERIAARASESPEYVMQKVEGALRAAHVADAFTTRDQRIVKAVADRGLSERDAARELGMSRGNLAHRLRLAREALGRAWDGTTSWMKGRRAH